MASKNPVCPHCNTELDEEETWHGEYTVGVVEKGDCDESEITCPNLDCKKTYKTRCVHYVRFEQVDDDE